MSKTAKLPRGHKRIAGVVYAPDAWKAAFVTRALKLAIGWPPDKEEQQRFRETLRRCERQARAVANWFTTEMYVQDRPALITPDDKLGKFTVGSLYQAAKQRFPLDDFDSSLLASLENTTRRYYMKERWQVAVGQRSLRSYRRLPFPIRSQAIKLYLDDEGKPRAKFTAARERFDLALIKSSRSAKPGRDNRRQWQTLVAALQDGLPWGECKLSTDAHGNPFLTIVMTLRKQAGRQRTGRFIAKSDSDALLVGLNDKDERLWVYNADHLIGWKHAHKRLLQRMSDDTKFEHRPGGIGNTRRQAAVEKFHHRMRTAAQQLAAMVVGYADRRSLATIVLDLRDKSFAPEFNWSQMTEAIKSAADALGILIEEREEENEKS